jgi:hypothetical protein
VAERAVTEPRFKPGFVYPRDEVGPYVEYEGTVTKVEDHDPEDDAEVFVDVEVPEQGVLRGEWRLANHSPPVGAMAIIRVYDTYMDNRIIRWSNFRDPHSKRR